MFLKNLFSEDKNDLLVANFIILNTKNNFSNKSFALVICRPHSIDKFIVPLRHQTINLSLYNEEKLDFELSNAENECKTSFVPVSRKLNNAEWDNKFVLASMIFYKRIFNQKAIYSHSLHTLENFNRRCSSFAVNI
jgi:hypothetical protein